jgi:NAD(P)-dependent dehydrogenase (short-subunit alcohol dehydrogenase family)
MQLGSQFLVEVHFTAGADSMSKLKGKVAVITGGSSGIGLATAKRFVEEGAYVFIAGRRQTELDKAVKEIGKCVTAVRSDVSKLEDLDNLYRTVAAQKRKIDILFANAGIVELKQTPDVTPEHLDKTVNTNARRLYFTVQKALPVMNDGGSIILNGSCVWLKGFPSYCTYSATKAALRSFARAWTTELKDRKTRTNVISPGAIHTHHRQPSPFQGGSRKNKSRVRLGDTTWPDGSAGRDCVSGPFLGFGRKQLRSGD